jgi:hypothetical protein
MREGPLPLAPSRPQREALRGCRFMGQGGRSYKHEFDGNDHHATHVLALVDEEPAGCCKIRYFGDFAKPERLAVLPKFRRGRYGKKGVPYEIAAYAFEFRARHSFPLQFRKLFVRIILLIAFYRADA